MLEMLCEPCPASNKVVEKRNSNAKAFHAEQKVQMRKITVQNDIIHNTSQKMNKDDRDRTFERIDHLKQESRFDTVQILRNGSEM
jgi:hypothetical protein